MTLQMLFCLHCFDIIGKKVKVKVHTLDLAPLCNESPPQKFSGMVHVMMGFHNHTFIRNWNEPYLPLCSQLVLIYRPWRDGRLSRATGKASVLQKPNTNKLLRLI